ncbi:MAG: diguanylate cyclase [Eubacterium sp.]|nr:diguanylate cyclase [Eubacterium sp.]
MKSLRTRFVSIFLGTILVIFFILAFVGVYYVVSAIELHSSQSMELLLEEKSEELDDYYLGIERSADVLKDYLINNVEIQKYQDSKTYREKIYSELKDRAISAANVVGGVETIYFRPDPELYGGTSGFFLSETEDGEYQSLTPTNILKYDKDDIEHVGWYYEPIENGGPMWMEPYSNKNINVYMISYVVPVYMGSDFLGIVGMDIDMTLVHQVIDEIEYQNSYGTLVSEQGNVLYNKDYSTGVLKSDFTGEIKEASQYFADEYANTGENYQFSYAKEKYRIVVSRLENQMMLAITTPESELFALGAKILKQFGFIFILILVLAIVVSMRVTRKIVSPLQELTVVSSRIANGELGQEVSYRSEDEIGLLADSIRKISVELKEYIDYIHNQSYLDAMTGVRNKAAYLAEVSRLERLIKEKMASFTIYVFDVNGLKKMNDSKGHEYGDMLIKDAALNIRAIFGGKQVYRVGGDEFVAIAKEQSEEEVRRCLACFDEHLRAFNLENDRYDEDLAISKGAASYNPERDVEFATVFTRADEQMYLCKAKYYEKHGDRRRR